MMLGNRNHAKEMMQRGASRKGKYTLAGMIISSLSTKISFLQNPVLSQAAQEHLWVLAVALQLSLLATLCSIQVLPTITLHVSIATLNTQNKINTCNTELGIDPLFLNY